MIDRTLQHLIEEKLTSAREISELAGVSTSTVYRWIAGESQPDFHSVRLLLRHLSHRRAQETLLSAFASGTGWHFLHSNCDKDVNHDGRVDTDDALDAAIETIKAAACTLDQLQKANRDQQLTADETMRSHRHAQPCDQPLGGDPADPGGHVRPPPAPAI